MEAQVKSSTITAVRMFFEYGIGAPDIVRNQIRQAEIRGDGPAIRTLQSVLHEFERQAEPRDEKDCDGLEAILQRWLKLRREAAGRRTP
jgi:hypothetical protein